MTDSPWQILSPLNFTFRAYDVEANRDSIMKTIEEALERFKYCDGIQIEITAPPKDPSITSNADGKRGEGKTLGTVVKGFAG